MCPQCQVAHEIYGVCARRDVVVGEQDSTGQFEKGRNSAVTGKIPFHAYRIQSHSICRVRRLKDKKSWYRIYGVFESAPQESRPMCVSQNPSIAKSQVPNPGVLGASGNGVTPASPDLNLVSSGFGALLR